MDGLRVAGSLLVVVCLVVAASGEVVDEQRTTDVEALIQAAIEKGAERIKIPSGVYRIPHREKKEQWHLIFKNARDLRIDATGVTFVFTNPAVGGMLLEDCHNVTLRGLTIQFDPLPFTQGTLVATDPEGLWYDLKLDDGYRDDVKYFKARLAAYVYDPGTRLLKPGTWDMYPKKVTRAGPGVFRLHWREPKKVEEHKVSMGDLMVLKHSAGGIIFLARCSGMTVRDVTIHSGPGIGIQEAGGEGGNHYSYTVTRGPAPEGATKRPLLSAGCDAFHSSGVKKGPVVADCTFEYQGDDGVAIHGGYDVVVTVGKSKTCRIMRSHVEPGDRLRLLDGKSAKKKGEAVVTKVKHLGQIERDQTATIKSLFEYFPIRRDYLHLYELTVEEELPFAVGDIVTSFDRNGSGFVVRNNTIRHHRARGILIKACNGLIEDNKLEDITQSGIALGPEIAYWLEASFVQNVVVRRNTLRNIGMGANVAYSAGNPKIGAISICASVPQGALSGVRENRNIVIEDNVIDGTGVAGLLVYCAANITVSGNRFLNTHQMDCAQAGTDCGLDPTAVIYVAESDNVVFADNTVSGMGKAGKNALVVAPSASNVVGGKEGVRLVK